VAAEHGRCRDDDAPPTALTDGLCFPPTETGRATSPSEIERQHASAAALLSSLPVHPRLEHGEIPLLAKRRPTVVELAHLSERDEGRDEEKKESSCPPADDDLRH